MRSGMILVVVSVALLDLYLLQRQSAHLEYTPPQLVALVMSMMSSSLIILGYIATSIYAASPQASPARPRNRLLAILSPSYRAAKLAMSRGTCLAAGTLAGLAYALLYMWSAGIITEATMPPMLSVVSEGPPGYAPILMFFPLGGVGVIIPIYQVAIVALLSAIVSLTTTILAYSISSGLLSRIGLGSGLAGAASGLLLSCPTCITPPLTAIMTTYLAPWGLSFIFGFLRGAAGTLLVYSSSLALLWAGFSLSSNTLERAVSCPAPRAGKS